MIISKKLFLITAVALNLGSLLNAYESTQQSVFNFAVTLSRQNNDDAKTIANWLLRELDQVIETHNTKNIDRIELILNAPLTLEEKIKALTRFKSSFIKKYALSPLYATAKCAKNLAITTAKVTVVPVAILAFAGAAMFSMEFGMQMGHEIAGQCIEFLKIIK